MINKDKGLKYSINYMDKNYLNFKDLAYVESTSAILPRQLIYGVLRHSFPCVVYRFPWLRSPSPPRWNLMPMTTVSQRKKCFIFLIFFIL